MFLSFHCCITYVCLNVYHCAFNSYPKGLLVAFKLKSTSAKNDKQELVVEITEEESEPKIEVKSSSETEQDKEPKKTSADMYKDNKDVVLREDLKSVFQKFGTVKVCQLLFLISPKHLHSVDLLILVQRNTFKSFLPYWFFHFFLVAIQY